MTAVEGLSGTALVLLAAGASERLGECKALVDLGGESPLERLVAAGRSISSARPLVVGGAHHAALAEALPFGCELVNNENWSAGRTGGIALAVQARAGFDLCIAPVDVPLVPRDVFWALQRAWQISGSPARGWLAPEFEGRYGHPILIGRDLVRELADWEPDRPLKELRDLAEERLGLGVAHPEILDDLDSPKDLEALRRRIRTR